MKLTHLDENSAPHMVNVGEKPVTRRRAVARSIVNLPPAVLDELIKSDMRTAKGAVFQTAIIAGIMAAKKTGELIPLCHPLGLDNCEVNIALSGQQEVIIDCIATITSKTGVEMEALVGATMAALTIYDMCKALSHDIVIRETRLIEKTGGKHDFRLA
jgi:cyclic pyranopterin monophosphate synthase